MKSKVGNKITQVREYDKEARVDMSPPKINTPKSKSGSDKKKGMKLTKRVFKPKETGDFEHTLK